MGREIGKETREFILLIIYILTLGIIFVADLMIPLGVAAGVPYIVPVLITIKSKRKVDTYIVGIIGILLTIVGYFTSPTAGGVPWMVVFNRGLAIFVIIVTTMFVIDRKGSEEKIMALNKELHELAHRDPLTGTENRLSFMKVIEEEVERAQRYNVPLSVIMFDIDSFKKINDTFGHATGDEVLKKLTEIIENNLRKSDKLFRVGGEEFVVTLPNTDIDKAKIVAEKLRKAVCKTHFGKTGRITISIGVTQVTEDDDVDTLITRVDEALYRAKNNGRNRVEVILS